MSKSIEDDVEDREDPRNFWIELLNLHITNAIDSMRRDDEVTDEEEIFIRLLNKVASENYIELSFYYSGLYNDARTMMYGEDVEDRDDE